MPREPRQRVRCKANAKNNGEPDRCPNYAMAGQLVCGQHGGKSPQARMAATVRLATQEDAFNFGNHPHLSPGESLMDLIASRHARLKLLGDYFSKAIDDAGGDLDKALTSDTYVTDSDGRAVKVGEHVKGLLQLETTLAGQLGQWDTAAIRAQIDIAKERRLAETAAQLKMWIGLLIADRVLALTPAQKRELPKALERVVDESQAG